MVSTQAWVRCVLQEQKLRPGEKIDMPVFFYVDPEFATDPRMMRVNHLTLSYTFFKVRAAAGACRGCTASLCKCDEPMTTLSALAGVGGGCG